MCASVVRSRFGSKYTTQTSKASAIRTMAYVTDLMKELDDIKSLVKIRGDHPMVIGLAESLASKIGTVVHWDSGSVVSMTKALSDSGLPIPAVQNIEAAIDARTKSYTASATGRTVAPNGAPPRDQSMRHMYNFLTCRDWAVLDDPKSSNAMRDDVLTNRLKRLGVRRASEDSLIKWAMCIIMEVEFRLSGRWTSYWDIYNRVVGLKSLMHGAPPYTGQHIDKYPEHPSELPDSVYQLAYDANDPPIQRYMNKYDQLAQHVPLRRSSKLLFGQQPTAHTSAWTQSWQRQSGRSYAQLDDGSVLEYNPKWQNQTNRCDRDWENTSYDYNTPAWRPLDSWRPANNTLAIEDHRTNPPTDAGVQPDVFAPPRPSASLNPPPKSTTPAFLSSAVTRELGDGKDTKTDRKSSEDIEDAAYKALINKQAAAKAKASAKAKAKKDAKSKNDPKVASKAVKTVAMKKAPTVTVTKKVATKTEVKEEPGLATPVVKKRPAGSTTSISDYVVKWDAASDASRDRHTFVSLHFGRARKLCTGLGPQETKDVVRPISQAAGVVWDKHMKKAKK